MITFAAASWSPADSAPMSTSGAMYAKVPPMTPVAAPCKHDRAKLGFARGICNAI